MHILSKCSIVLLSLLALSTGVAGQARKAPSDTPSPAVWKTAAVNKLGLRELQLPPDAKPGEVTDHPAISTDKIPTDYLETKWTAGSGKAVREISIMITNWHTSFAEVTGKPANLVTPESLVLLDYMQGQKAVKEKSVHTVFADMLDVDSVPGSYVVLNSPIDGLVVVWGTSRYYKGNAQQVMVSVSRFTRAEALRIIRSIKFDPSDANKAAN